MIEIDVIDTPSLGDRGYLATDGSVALVIDPQRDFDRIADLAAERGVQITHVFETHIHNDYVTGGLALAKATGAAYHVNAADQVGFDRTPVADGDLIEVGDMAVRVIATPGHTFTHLSYALGRGSGDAARRVGDAPGGDAGQKRDAGEVIAVFTGGSLLNGSTGRTDLLGPEHKVALARAQYNSAHRLVAELPAATLVCPTHGFGSFCSASATTGAASTIFAEISANPVLTLDETTYVEATLAGLDAYPAYYVHMAGANSAGPLAPDLTPPGPVSAGELRRRIGAGEWVVDLRSRIAFAAGHIRGALQFELGDSMATYLGWLIPWGTPLTLIGETPQDVMAAQRELVRIGIDKVQAAASGAEQNWAGGEPLASYPVADFAGYLSARTQSARTQSARTQSARTQSAGTERKLVLLDVRRDSEWAQARIDGAVHIPLHELAGRLAEVPAGQIWVHCHVGYRASIAASLLDAAGRDVVLINDEFGNAARLGLADG